MNLGRKVSYSGTMHGMGHDMKRRGSNCDWIILWQCWELHHHLYIFPHPLWTRVSLVVVVVGGGGGWFCFRGGREWGCFFWLLGI